MALRFLFTNLCLWWVSAICCAQPVIGHSPPKIDTNGLTQHQIDSIKQNLFDNYLIEMELAYKQPKGFRLLATPYYDTFICQQGNYAPSFAKVIINSDSSIAIGIVTYPMITKTGKDAIEDRMNTKGFDVNKNWENLIRNYRTLDTSMAPEHYYDPAFIAETSRADIAGEFVRHCIQVGINAGENRYRNDYKYYKTAFITKKDRGNMEIVYFYKEGTRPDGLDDFIVNNAEMLRYK